MPDLVRPRQGGRRSLAFRHDGGAAPSLTAASFGNTIWPKLNMKLLKNFATGLVLASLVTLWAGCQTHPTTTPLSNGYEEVSHPYRAWMDEAPPPRVALQYRAKDETITPIWDSLFGVNEVIKGDLVVFVGEVAYYDPDRATRPRLFAAKPKGLPLDITDEAMARWAKTNGRNAKTAAQKVNIIVPAEKDGGIELSFEFSSSDKWTGHRDDWPDESTLALTWLDVNQFMQTVKTNGIEKKDIRWQTSYLGKKQ